MKMNFGNKHGYLDPGTGNALFAALFGILGSIAFFAKNAFYSVAAKITGKEIEKFSCDLAIFSEGKMYWVYLKDVVEELIRRKVKFAYYTMDIYDPALDLHDFSNADEDFSYFEVKYVGTGNKGYSAISNLKEKNVLTTTPNIGTPGYPVKKPGKCENLIYIFHALGLGLKKGGLDNFDTILLHQINFSNIFKGKKVVLAGLPYLDSLIEKAGALQNKTDGKTVLVASTWGKRGCLQTYGSKFINALSNAGFNVIVRPHPYSYKIENDFIENLQNELPGIVFDKQIDNLECLSQADILISDISGVRFDFYLCFGRPVISLECEIDDEYEHNEWLFDVGNDMGVFVKKKDIETLPQIAKNMAKKKLADKNSILANIGKSKDIIADYLEELAMDTRIYSSRVNIDEQKACAFWRSRAKKYTETHPYVAVNLGDSNPERSVAWDRYEKNNVLPFLQANEQSNVLDIGCGVGRLAEYFVPKCKFYLGIDYSTEFIEIAKQRVADTCFLPADIKNCNLSNLQIKEIIESKGKFNILVLNEILFYINDRTILDSFTGLLPLLSSNCKIYVNNAVAIKERLTLKDFYSEELQNNYNSIYRTEQEYIELYKPLFEAGFKLEQSGNFEIETAGKETKRIFHILKRGD